MLSNGSIRFEECLRRVRGLQSMLLELSEGFPDAV